MKMALIGAGMMGSAIVSGMVKNGIIAGNDIYASDPDTQKLIDLHEKLGLNAAVSNLDAVKAADLVLLAVKPQFLGGVLDELYCKIPEETLVITIVAGVPVARYTERLACDKIVRVMPNTPAQVGEGMCAWFATDAVSEEQKHLAEEILTALGVQMQVGSEHMLDLVTAVSGSGPAYVYLFIEAMMDTAVHLGLPRKTAEKLVLQTVIGSARYMQERGSHPAQLRNEVTSPGGTTAEALSVMERDGLRSAVADGMWACYERTLELGKK